MSGRLYGVGLGPGDPELVTVKAARLIAAAGVIAYHAARHGRSNARAIAEPYLRPDQIEEPLIYPVTTETTDHPGGYQGAIDEFYAAAADRLAAHLDAGRDVVVLAEGDPVLLRVLHAHAQAAGAPVRDRGGARGDVGERRGGGARPAADGTRRGADRPAGHPAPAGAGRPPGRHRLGRDHEAGPYLRRRPGGPRAGRPPRRRLVRRTGHHRSRACRPAGRRRPGDRAVLLPRPAAHPGCRRRRPARGRGSGARPGHGDGDRPRSRRPGVAHSRRVGRHRRRRRPDRLRPLPRPGRRPTRASAGTPRTTGSRPSGPRSPSTWPSGAGGWRWSRPAIRACSRWPPRCWRRPRTRSGRTCRSGSCRG